MPPPQSRAARGLGSRRARVGLFFSGNTKMPNPSSDSITTTSRSSAAQQAGEDVTCR